MANILANTGGGAELLEYGVRHVQVPAPDLDKVEEVQADLKAKGLSAIGLTAMYLEEDSVATPAVTQAWINAFDAAVKMNVNLALSSIKAEEELREKVCDWLKTMGDEAAKRGITVALETHPSLLHNADVALKTMEATNHPNIRINFDTGNISFYTDGADAVEELEKVAEYVVSTHLKDHSGNFQEWEFGTLGTGAVDFAGIRRVLEAVNFQGPWIVQAGGDLTESFAYLHRLGYGA
ncbi:MAG: sugar phosphate isomerase/epimerase [Candidatus Poribacteria bacterium]|nr:sugar phosphate isomerase/epimerase [Candidatus Poribacteria bacterium]